MTRSFAVVKELPDTVQAALKSVDYHRADIAMQASSSVVLSSSGGKGTRHFVVMVNLSTGQHIVTWGSWGGQNMFTPDNAVDNDRTAYALPADGIAITGSVDGGRPTFATIHVPASMVDRMLPAPGPDLTKEETDALYCHASIKGGQYRRDELDRRNVSPETVERMVARGFIKRNKAGASSITTEGRNAVSGYRGY